MTKDKPRYTLKELLTGEPHERTQEEQEWLDAPPVGREVFSKEFLEEEKGHIMQRLIDACAAIRDYLEASTDERDRRIAYRKKVNAMTMSELKAEDGVAAIQELETPVERLKRQIVEMEAKDAKIREFREALDEAIARER